MFFSIEMMHLVLINTIFKILNLFLSYSICSENLIKMFSNMSTSCFVWTLSQQGSIHKCFFQMKLCVQCLVIQSLIC